MRERRGVARTSCFAFFFLAALRFLLVAFLFFSFSFSSSVIFGFFVAFFFFFFFFLAVGFFFFAAPGFFLGDFFFGEGPAGASSYRAGTVRSPRRHFAVLPDLALGQRVVALILAELRLTNPFECTH